MVQFFFQPDDFIIKNYDKFTGKENLIISKKKNDIIKQNDLNNKKGLQSNKQEQKNKKLP